MNLWRLEWLRLVRTKRWLIILAAFAIFGFLGPLTAKYIAEIIGSNTGNIKIIVPPPVPADGFSNYVKNAMQIGLLAAIVIAAGALAIDAKTGLSIFYKTRVLNVFKLLLPRFVVVTVAVLISFIIGTLAAWYETVILLGHVSVVQVLFGILFESIYLVFVMAVVAFSSTFAKGVLGTVGISLAVVLLLPIIGIVNRLADWLPSMLVGSMDALIRDNQPEDYIKSLIVTIILITFLLLVAALRYKNKELQS